MSGSVKYQLQDPAHLPYGPVATLVRPGGLVVVAVDRTQIDPLVTPALESLGSAILTTLTQLDRPQEKPALKCTIWRTRNLSGGRYLEAELAADTIDLYVAQEMISAALAEDLAVAATAVTRHFMR